MEKEGNENKQKRVLFKTWLEGRGGGVSWNALLEALGRVDSGLKERVRTIYLDQQPQRQVWLITDTYSVYIMTVLYFMCTRSLLCHLRRPIEYVACDDSMSSGVCHHTFMVFDIISCYIFYTACQGLPRKSTWVHECM